MSYAFPFGRWPQSAHISARGQGHQIVAFDIPHQALPPRPSHARWRDYRFQPQPVKNPFCRMALFLGFLYQPLTVDR